MSNVFESVKIDSRTTILQAALYTEDLVSSFLAKLLDIEDHRKSKVLHGSQSISFNQKINLLIEISALESNDRTVYQKFMEIRNTFLHDLNSDTYQKCVNEIHGCEKWLLKTYKSDNKLDKEDQLKQAIEEGLIPDVLGKTVGIIRQMKIKIEKDITVKLYENITKAYGEIIGRLKDVTNRHFDLLIHQKEKLDPGKYKNIGDKYVRIIHGYVLRKSILHKNDTPSETKQ